MDIVGVQRLDVGPADKIVVRMDSEISSYDIQIIEKYVQEHLGVQNDILVLGRGMTIGVITEKTLELEDTGFGEDPI